MGKKDDPIALLADWIGDRPLTQAAPEAGLNADVLSRILKRKYKVGAKVGRRLEQRIGIDHRLWWDDKAA
jgi:antitoxin component HigA of HigAB toxin-antitoxin module